MSVMRYRAVIESVSKKCGLPKETVKDVIDQTVETVIKNTINGKTVQIEGFGSFLLRFLNRRTLPQNYLTGEEAIAESHFKIAFKEYAEVKRRIYEKYDEMLRTIREFEKAEMEKNGYTPPKQNIYF